MNQQLKTLSLFPRESKPPSQTSSLTQDPQVWLAVCLTHLALQSQACALSDQPVVVVEASQGQLCVHTANGKAYALGIGPGLRLSAALAISDQLRIVKRSERAEHANLHSLALSFQSLTPIVSLEPPDAVLLEVRASLKLFGGIEKIRELVAKKIGERRLSCRFSIAPTASGALWLVRHGRYEVDTFDDLARRVRSLPLGVTAWPKATQARLGEMGVVTLGDCLRLPRDGFSKRVGARYLRDLDKALGRETELRAVMKSPQKLTWKVDFLSETIDLKLILEAAESLLDQLVSVLRERQMQVRSFSFSFHYLHREAHAEAFELLDASHERQRIWDLVSDRLERLGLPAPIIALELRTDVLQDMQINDSDLFENGGSTAQQQGIGHALIERLRERLGPRSVHGLALTADYRPESAWLKLADSTGAKHAQRLSPWAGARPLWLLPSPSRLTSEGGEPVYNGSLQLRSGPERIESGWWDQRDVRRDYYTAVSERGERLWIFLDRAADAWFLHGVFG